MTDANQDTLKVDLLSTMPKQNQDQKQVDNEQSRHIDECADTSFGDKTCSKSELKLEDIVDKEPLSPSVSDNGNDAVNENQEAVDRKPRVVMQAIGIAGSEYEEETKASLQQHIKEKEHEDNSWTEMAQETEIGTVEHKRSSNQHFFSLMNLLKFLLNPVIEEFQVVEKSPNGSKVSTKIAQNANTSGLLDKEQNKNASDSSKKTKFQCLGRNVTENVTATVRVVNSTELLEMLSFEQNHTHSDCVLVMFFAPWCHFCAATAPHYNALGRAFLQLDVLAVDTVHFSNLNARFGTVAVPNIMLFHQSRSAIRFNHTERNFENLVQFIQNTTGLEPNASVELTKEDFEGPLSSIPTEETDYLLWFAWIFTIICGGHLFIQSSPGQHVIEKVRILWQEHQHIE
ncbi:hypothetical protein C0Q70_00443 [Pomacea canaliculata]|uniref:Thioredoxin domain-containing protein n=2 Tax=Pomacea canaliculata TaxID=400727 RepID=A0A2T7PWN9_POMCA|nr:hypothetical protein C0Q70_00443 [Pomacea canaliculata]